MKAADEPTNLQELELLLIEASKLTNHRHFVIAGSLSALGAVVSPPVEMVLSRDVDLYPKFDPERGFAEIAQQLSETSEFHARIGVYADPITPKLLALPDGWEGRLLQLPLQGGVVAWFLDPNDAAISKLMRGADNDLRWVRAGLAEGVLSMDVLDSRLRSTHNGLEEDFATARRSLALLRTGSNGTAPPRWRG